MSGKIQNLLEQANHSGAEDASEVSYKRNFLTETEAAEFFGKVRKNLLDLEIWSEKSTLSNYESFDENGNVTATKILAAGRFIRIEVKASGKYDWVKVLEIHDADDEFIITVQPAYDPTADPSEREVTSHFFTSEATNNFCLQRTGKSVALYVIGLNEKTNVKETDGAIDAIRNVTTANLGYYLGIQKTMWTEFCKEFLEIN